jgi:hypothetical protein
MARLSERGKKKKGKKDENKREDTMLEDAISAFPELSIRKVRERRTEPA